MQHIQVRIPATDDNIREELIAGLSGLNYEGFEEMPDGLLAYIPQGDFHEDELAMLSGKYGLEYEVTVMPLQNWNAKWEENFQPVIVEDFCTVRADFHKLELNTPYEIVITPKMSFGTGHHATTRLVMMQMREIDFKGKSVLDFGTGTGILAILAEMLGAAAVMAIDNDEWSYENARENIGRNNCTKTQVQLATLDDLQDDKYNIILANINRHILLQYMAPMYGKLNADGIIVMSGIMPDDEEIVVHAAKETGFVLQRKETKDNWLVLVFNK